jgi:5-formyltetrahydrofolate cyclo-ligase
MTQTKTEWRRALLSARAAIPASVRSERSAAIVERLRRNPDLERAGSVLCYVAMGAEADPAALLASFKGAGIPMFVPAFADWPAEPRWALWGAPNGMSGGDIGAKDLRSPVVAIVPGVGFDEQGVRLGRGGGFYDRALAELRSRGPVCAIGLGFDCQIVTALPADSWDQPVDLVVSESRVVESRGAEALGQVGARWS